jgi:glucose/arabinose dehydrogenase
MKKLIIISLLLFLLLIYFFGSTLVGTKNPIEKKGGYIENILSAIPLNLKQFIRSAFYSKEEKISILEDENDKLKKKIFFYEYTFFNNETNKVENVNFLKNYEKKINVDENIYFLKTFSNTLLTNPKNTRAKSTGYFDFYNNLLIFAGGDGVIGYFELDSLNNDSFDLKLIKSNLGKIINYKEFFLPGDLGVKDILIDKKNKYIYLSYNKNIKNNCFNISILRSKLDFEYLNFEDFFSPEECLEVNPLSRNQVGGKLFKKNNDYLFLSIGAFGDFKKPQDKQSVFGSIIEINLKNNKEFKIISKGHRNSQGIYYEQKNEILLSVDHGPQYGDEINLDYLPGNFVKNFGWPISSYGDHYDFMKKKILDIYKDAPLYKSHKDYGFQEPIKFYLNNIAPSGIIYVPDTYNNKKNNYFISALGHQLVNGAKSIYDIQFDDNYKNIIQEKVIPIGERIRDIKYYVDKNIIIMFLEDSSSFAFLKKIK